MMDQYDESSRDSVVLEAEDLQYLNMTNMPFTTLSNEYSTTDTSAIHNGSAYDTNTSSTFTNGINSSQSRVVIVEQPQQRGFRFRYECEGPSHGGLQGEKTERGRKTYPSIRVENYQGPARIEVSLVTDESPSRIHAHKLVGKNCNKDGLCKIDINSTASQISFQNLCILHVTRKKASEVLCNRLLEELKINKQVASGQASEPNITAEERLNIKQQASEQARGMQLNVVRLQFRVFLPNEQGEYLIMLPPVVSQPIYDSKSPGASALKICRMDKYGGCCTGNEEVFLLCEKVQKEDIAVRFVENNPDGTVKWEAYGNFSPLDVHRQYAIVFKTPAYYNANIDKAVNVMIMLQRKSDTEVSEAKAFTYYPQNKDKDNIARKKRKTLPLDSTFNYYGGDGGGPPGPGGGMGGFGPSTSGGSGGLGGGGLGGGGGGNIPNNFSVIMPNGSIVDHMNCLPTTVEQVVKEEFARSSLSSTSPDTVTSTSEDSYQSPLASPYDPILWATNMNMNDLEMDAAHSLTHPSQRSFATHLTPDLKQELWDVIPERRLGGEILHESVQKKGQNLPRGRGGKGGAMDLAVGRFPVQEESKGGLEKEAVGGVHSAAKLPQQESQDTVDGLAARLQSVTVGEDTAEGSNSALAAEEEAKGCSTEAKATPIATATAAAVSGGSAKPEASLHRPDGRKKIVDVPTSNLTFEVIVESGDDASTTTSTATTSTAVGRHFARIHRPPQSEADSGRELSDAPLSPTRLSTERSEGFRTDEGFSEVSAEDGSPVPSKEGKPTKVPPTKTKSKKEGSKETTVDPVKAATRAVKRVMARITARTIRALQEYSETADPRYLLILQRHLTTIKNENGDLPIHLAVINNQTPALRNLLDVMTSLPNARHAINTYNYTTQTALHIAAIMTQALHIEMLLHAGADPSLADRSGNTPAHLAVLNNSLEALRSLVKYLRPGTTTTDPFPELNYLNYDGYAPVHLAVMSSNVDMLRLLVHGKANVDMPDGKSGRTPLHHAVELDDLPVAGFLLLEAEADVNARCFDGNTPLHIACCRGLIGMVALLMTAGALTDVENEEIPSEEELEPEEGEGVEESLCRDRRGLQPRDYVAGKDRQRILSMLLGEQCLSDEDDALRPQPLTDPDLEEDSDMLITNKSVCDSGVSGVSLMSSPSSLQAEDI